MERCPGVKSGLEPSRAVPSSEILQTLVSRQQEEGRSEEGWIVQIYNYRHHRGAKEPDRLVGRWSLCLEHLRRVNLIFY